MEEKQKGLYIVDTNKIKQKIARGVAYAALMTMALTQARGCLHRDFAGVVKKNESQIVCGKIFLDENDTCKERYLLDIKQIRGNTLADVTLADVVGYVNNGQNYRREYNRRIKVLHAPENCKEGAMVHVDYLAGLGGLANVVCEEYKK